jgi:hypothetical protein
LARLQLCWWFHLSRKRNASLIGATLLPSAQNILGLINVSISDRGPLPGSGGSLAASLLDVQLPPTLTLDLLSANTNGSNNQTTSQASVTNQTIPLLVGSLVINEQVSSVNIQEIRTARA